jgi:hypothetical protein
VSTAKKPKSKAKKKPRLKAGHPDKPMSQKEQGFVNAIVSGKPDLEAYDSCYSTKGQEKNRRNDCYRLKKRPNVAKAIRMGQEKLARISGITADSLMIELEEARQVSKKESNGTGMTAATMGKAKLCGLDKLVVIIPDADKLTPWSSIVAGVAAGVAESAG